MLHLSARLRERERDGQEKKLQAWDRNYTKYWCHSVWYVNDTLTHSNFISLILSYDSYVIFLLSVTIVTWLLIYCRLLIRSREMTGNSGLRRQTSRSSQPISLPGASASWHGTWIPTRFNRGASSCSSCWHAMNSNGFQWIMTWKQNHWREPSRSRPLFRLRRTITGAAISGSCWWILVYESSLTCLSQGPCWWSCSQKPCTPPN